MKRLDLLPISLEEANDFIKRLHRHHGHVQGHKFSLGAVMIDRWHDGPVGPWYEGHTVGVVIVGRPVARLRDDGMTLEVTRLCTDGTKNVCSFLYGAAARAAFALGYRKIGTYILHNETGTSLQAAGWRLVGTRGGGTWDRAGRPRQDRAPTNQKLLWEKTNLTIEALHEREKG